MYAYSSGQVACNAGINQWESDKPARYVSNTNLSSRVASLNPPWNGDQSEQASDAQFQKAMELTGHEFMEALEYYSNVSLFCCCFCISEQSCPLFANAIASAMCTNG